MRKKIELYIIAVICLLLIGCGKTDKQIDIEDFKDLEIGITEKEVIEKIGTADEEGAGFHSSTYQLKDDTEVTLYFDEESKLIRVRHWLSEDEYNDIISNN